MIIAGAILIALGIGSTIYGFHLNNSMEVQLNALFGSGNVDPGTGWIVTGIIALVIGIALLVVGITKKPRSTPDNPKTLCPHCKKKLDGSPEFCPFCGESTKSAKPPKDIVCPFCESILPVGVAFCPACGKRVGSEPNPIKPIPFPDSIKPAKPSDRDGWSTPTDTDL